MPELPEVQVSLNYITPKILGKTISKCVEHIPQAWSKSQLHPSNAIGYKVTSTSRRGKYFLLHLTHNKKDPLILTGHLKMSGRVHIADKNEEYGKHERASIEFTDGTRIVFTDTRKFGRLWLSTPQDQRSNTNTIILGPEPWDEKLTPDFLIQKLKRHSIPIKSVLLAQKAIAGIGNIYADEILFAAHIHPESPSNKITKLQAKDIIEHTKRILEIAIENEGTTIHSFIHSKDKPGQNQKYLKVYGKAGQMCPVCQSTLEKIIISARTTTLCAKCQKKPK